MFLRFASGNNCFAGTKKQRNMVLKCLFIGMKGVIVLRQTGIPKTVQCLIHLTEIFT